MVFEIEEECLEVYRRKVDKANRSRAQLRPGLMVCKKKRRFWEEESGK